ncbi:hypothetical protein GQ457_07G018510 [Hibiscus cannabinus]
MSMLEIHDMIKELGYATPYNLYWQKPWGILKVSPLRTDSDMLTMLGALPRQKYIHVYIEENVGHLVDTNEDEIAWIDEHETVWFDADDNVDNTVRNAETIRSVEIVRNAETVRIDETVRNVKNVRIDETVRTDETVGSEAEFDDENSSEDDDYVVSDHEDSDSPLEDSENDLADSGDEVCDVHVGVGVGVGRDIPGFSAAVGENEEMDNESDIDGSDLLHSASESETNEKKKKMPEFNSETDMKNPKFKKGMVFSHQSVIKAAVKQYAVLNGKNVRLKVNDSRRLQVVCKAGCPWMIWASRLHPKDINETTWQIKTYIGDHSCIRDTKNANCTARWLAKTYIDKWRVDPTYSNGSLQKDVQHDHILQVPLTKCSRAKQIALEMIHGNEDEQYGRIYDYIAELRGRNPGTTIICKLDNRVFERIYICLQACKDGFKAGCRPIISIDGCFLKGHFQEDLELTNSHHYTFMSDKQKGLMEGISELFPNAEHRTCVRHLYSNFKNRSGFQGKTLKDALWKAARATYMKEFIDSMTQMRAISEEAFEWLQKKDPAQWSKSHFATHCKSDMLLNNMCESFNKIILEARDKPILTMLEIIRCKIMNRFAKKAEEAQKIVGPLCPKIQKKIDALIVQSVRCWPRNAGGNRYEVPAGHEDQHVVDLGAESCTCRKWDLTGIPCVHATAVIIMRGERPEGFVNNCYKTETQLQIYSNLVKPLRGPKQWPRHVTNEPILPPVIRRPVGRPQRNRRKEADEILTSTGRMPKKGVVRMTCSKCGNSGHNKRSCKGVVGGNRPLASNSSARKSQRKTRRVANSIVPQQVSTQEKPVSTAYIPPTDRISKLSVKRIAPGLQATSSSQHCPNTSQASVTNVRWMPSQKTQSSVQSQSHQAEDPTSKRPRWR